MKRILPFLFVVLLYTQTFAQNITPKNWSIDIDSLQQKLLQKEYLFDNFTKKEFKKQLQQLKKELATCNDKMVYWKLAKILSLFKNSNLQITKDTYLNFPFEVKQFKNGYYLTKIYRDYYRFLGCKLLAINGVSISKLTQKINVVNASSYKNIANKSLLEFLQISKRDTLKLTLLSDKKTSIELPFIADFMEEEMEVLHPKKTPFYQEKSERWFWMYGINFGQQVFFKYNVGLSKEFFTKMKDSLGWNAFDCAKKYNIRLQSVYDAPNFRHFSQKLVQKFNNPRYKKLFIDLRNNKKGDVYAIKELLNQVAKIKRINKKNGIYLLMDKSISSSAIATILAFKKKTKALVIGEIVTGTSNNTNKIGSFYLPNSSFQIRFPVKKLERITITPSIIVEKTIHHYMYGIDPVLQKVLEQ